jgi:hypothetical protein
LTTLVRCPRFAWLGVPFRDNAFQRGVFMNLNRDQKLSVGLVILFLAFSVLVLWAALQGPLAS